MFKKLGYMLAGGFLACMVGAAFAIGTQPISGPALVDGIWLNGLAGGQNNSYQSGLTALGNSHATSLQLTTGKRGYGYKFYEVDTTSASTGVSLPTAVAGMELKIYNAGLQTLTVYPAISNNPATAAQDTINGTTSFSGGVATVTALACFVAKTGSWACK